MGIINRLFIFVYALTVGILLAMVATAAFGVVPENEWLSEVRYWFARHEFYTVLGVLSLFSLYFILYALLVTRPDREETQMAEDEFVLIQDPKGEVKVSVEAIKKLAEKEAELVHSVRTATAEVTKVKKAEAPFRLELELVILVGTEVAAVSAEVTQQVNRQFKQTFGLENLPITIKVNEITNAPVENQKRVV